MKHDIQLRAVIKFQTVDKISCSGNNIVTMNLSVLNAIFQPGKECQIILLSCYYRTVFQLLRSDEYFNR